MNIQWMESIKENQIALPESLIDSLPKANVITIHYGSNEIELNVIKDVELPKETIGLSMNLSSLYTIPTDLSYDCLLIDGQIYIGPIIAYIVTGRLENYNDETLSIFSPRFKVYEDMKGLIFICTKDLLIWRSRL